MTGRKIFNNAEHDAAFKKNGFIVLGIDNLNFPLSLKEELLQLHPSDNYRGNQETKIGQQSFHVTFFDSNHHYRAKVFESLNLFFHPIAQKILHSYKCVQANVFLKLPHSGFVYPHQNLTIVNEDAFSSLSFWQPLQDTNSDNGTLFLVPGSHKGFVKYRNSHVYWPYVKFFKEGAGLNYFVPVNVKAGELLVLDDRLIHFTPANNTATERWVFHSLWAPQEADICFFDPQKEKVDKYLVEDDFWQYHAPGALPGKYNSLITLQDTELILSEDELVKKLNELKEAAKTSL